MTLESEQKDVLPLCTYAACIREGACSQKVSVPSELKLSRTEYRESTRDP